MDLLVQAQRMKQISHAASVQLLVFNVYVPSPFTTSTWGREQEGTGIHAVQSYAWLPLK